MHAHILPRVRFIFLVEINQVGQISFYQLLHIAQALIGPLFLELTFAMLRGLGTPV